MIPRRTVIDPIRWFWWCGGGLGPDVEEEDNVADVCCCVAEVALLLFPPPPLLPLLPPALSLTCNLTLILSSGSNKTVEQVPPAAPEINGANDARFFGLIATDGAGDDVDDDDGGGRGTEASELASPVLSLLLITGLVAIVMILLVKWDDEESMSAMVKMKWNCEESGLSRSRCCSCFFLFEGKAILGQSIIPNPMSLRYSSTRTQ